MARRVGFGDETGDRRPAVRRRGDRPPPPSEPQAASASPEPPARPQSAPAPAPTPWGAASSRAEPADPRKKEGRSVSAGRFIMAGLLWLFVIGALSEHYGGLAGLVRTAEGVAEGWLSPAELLAPFGPVMLFALFFTWLLLSPRKRR
ncbi:MAG: hypothetical protein AAGM38_13590 [Pseudomonadota bacterium]